MSEKLRRNVHNGGIESKKEEVGRKKRVVLFNAFKFCVHDIIKKKRRKEKEKGGVETRNPFETKNSQLTQLRWEEEEREKSLFSEKLKREEEGRVNEAVAQITLCGRYLSQCFALVRSPVMRSRGPRRGYPPPFSSPSPLYFRFLPPDRSPIPSQNPMKFIHLTATPDTRLPGITRLI